MCDSFLEWTGGRVLHSSVQFISEEPVSQTTSSAANLGEAGAAVPLALGSFHGETLGLLRLICCFQGSFLTHHFR